MSTLINYGARARLSVGRDKNQPLSGQSRKVNSSRAAPEKTQVNRLSISPSAQKREDDDRTG
jgi:hypothetical protein